MCAERAGQVKTANPPYELTPTPTRTSSRTPTGGPTPTKTRTPTKTPTATLRPTFFGATKSATPQLGTIVHTTFTATSGTPRTPTHKGCCATRTWTKTATRTLTLTGCCATRTPTKTLTPSKTPSNMPTWTPSITPRKTDAPTLTPSNTPTNTPIGYLTPTPTATITPTTTSIAGIPVAQTWKFYYYAGSERVAMRVYVQNQQNNVYYLFGDHLGSTSEVRNPDGTLYSRQWYKAFGEMRYQSSAMPTNRLYTGQLEIEFGLYHYGARIYDPSIMVFTSPDTLVPDPYNPLDWNRYQYARANPLKYSDPSGHIPVDIIVDLLFLAYDVGAILIEGPTPMNQAALAADAVCAVIPYGTGGGLAVRLGGEAAIQGVTHLPAGVRALQAAEKLAQFAANSDPNSSGSSLPGQSTNANPGRATTNSHGDPFPTIIDPRTGQPVQAPPDNLTKVPSDQRVE